MNNENKDILINLLNQHKELGISEQIDYNKFYLYSIIYPFHSYRGIYRNGSGSPVAF